MAKVQGVKPKKAVKPDAVLESFRELTRTRYRMALQIYEAQDGLTREIIDRIRDRLSVASTGVVSVYGKPYRIEQEYIDYNILFLACEIMSDLAMMNIQIANFEPSELYCAECKSEIFGVRNRSKKKRR